MNLIIALVRQACLMATLAVVVSTQLSASQVAADYVDIFGRIGLGFLRAAGAGLAMAARFPMDPVSTAPKQMSFAGRMHGVSFLIGVPCQILATLLLSLALGPSSHASLPLLLLTAVIWLSLGMMVTIMLMVGPGKPPNPNDFSACPTDCSWLRTVCG